MTSVLIISGPVLIRERARLVREGLDRGAVHKAGVTNDGANAIGRSGPILRPLRRSILALTGSDREAGFRNAPGAASLLTRVRAFFSDASHSALAQRVAGTAFLIRVASAGIMYLSQVLLARWMGSHEFGIYIYVWTWVLLIGGLFDLGLAQGAQRFIPQYVGEKRLDLLRGFLSGSRWLAGGIASVAALASALCVYLVTPLLDDYLEIPLFLACICLPAYAMGSVLDGIGRSYNWLHLGMAPPFVVRPLMIIAFMAAAHAAGAPVDARTAMLAVVGAIWITTIGQWLLLDRKLDRTVPAAASKYEVRAWLATSIPILLVESFYLLLTYTDILVLKHFRPPEEIAIYYAAAKTLALVAFVNFSVSAAVAHRFSEYHVSGDRERLSGLLTESIRWTFWPSLAATGVMLALGLPFLWMFGPDFASGYPMMFVLAIGLLARAAVGPVERLLTMLGHQKLCAGVYALSFALHLGVCLLLVPKFGAMGAAASTAAALVVESIMLFVVTKRRLGLHVFIWRR
jgi:O-antigen/teichoic acid export membrane protein